MAINGENVVGIAGKRDDAEAVTLVGDDSNDRERSRINGARIIPATKTVNEVRVGITENTQY